MTGASDRAGRWPVGAASEDAATATGRDAVDNETTQPWARGTGCPELALLLDRLTAERYRAVPPPPGTCPAVHRPATLGPDPATGGAGGGGDA